MPAYASLLARYSLVVVRGEEPFELNDLFQLAQDRMDNAKVPDDLNLPLLLDLRDVDLLRFESGEVQRLMRMRAGMGKANLNNPCAYVGRDERAFGMLRMMSAYAEINSVRQDQNQFVTQNMMEAVKWLYPRLDAPKDEEQALLELVQ